MGHYAIVARNPMFRYPSPVRKPWPDEPFPTMYAAYAKEEEARPTRKIGTVVGNASTLPAAIDEAKRWLDINPTLRVFIVSGKHGSKRWNSPYKQGQGYVTGGGKVVKDDWWETLEQDRADVAKRARMND
jgi:hypothetical protein